MNNIYPIFDQVISKDQKEQLLKQHAVVIWMVGLSGSGKSTLARTVEHNLHQLGYHTHLLDGDNLRVGVNNNLGFSAEDRTENIRRAAEVAKLFYQAGTVTICSLISPTKEIRQMASDILGEAYFEVYVNCPLEVCEQRDVKGLYAKARRGEIKDFTGISSPFDAPENPHLEVRTDLNSLESCQATLMASILQKIKFQD